MRWGWGWSCFFDERLVVPDHALKLYDGAIAPWRKGKSPYFLQTIQSLAKHYEFDAKNPVEGFACPCEAGLAVWFWG